MFDVTEEMKIAGALSWRGHRCRGAESEYRGDDKCWNGNEYCHCRIAYEGAEQGFRAMIREMPISERAALILELGGVLK